MTTTITIPMKSRESPTFVMDLDNDSVQAVNIKLCLDDNRLPEQELIFVLARAIRPGDYVIDCGACTGFFTLVMGALGANVLAIEPGDNNLPALYTNVALNKFTIEVRPVALGNQESMRPFLLMDDGGVNSFTQPADRMLGMRKEVRVKRLVDLVTTAPRLIKLDIEGSEFEVLEDWLKGPYHCPYICAEYNLTALHRADHTGNELRQLMRAHGYEMWLLFSDGMLPMHVPHTTQVKCTKQNVDVLFAKPDDVGALWPEIIV